MLFAGTNAQSSFFYDAMYSNEGGMLTLIVCVAILSVLVVLLRQKKQRAHVAPRQ